MKRLFLISMLFVVSGCARSEYYPRHIHHHRHFSEINISDQQHTNYVVSIIMRKINSRSAQERGYVYISSRWFYEQGLEDDQSQLVFDYLIKNGYSVSYHDHESSHIGSWALAANTNGNVAGALDIEKEESNDILISW